jgi:hypothetical protein
MFLREIRVKPLRALLGELGPRGIAPVNRAGLFLSPEPGAFADCEDLAPHCLYHSTICFRKQLNFAYLCGSNGCFATVFR